MEIDPVNPMRSFRFIDTLSLSLWLLVAITTPVFADNADPAQKQGYDLGAFPYLSSYQMIEAYGPVAKQLGRAIGKPVRLRSAGNFEKFSRNLRDEIYDIAVIQPFDYLDATQKFHYHPIVRVDEPLITTFVVRADSQLKSLLDLKGKKLAFPPKPSANARMARTALAEIGLVPGRDVTIVYHNSHDSCMHDVLIGRAVACPSGGAAIRLFEDKRHVQLKILATTPAIPHVSIVAHDRVPVADRIFLQRWFDALDQNKKGKALLHALHFPGFVAASDSDYQILANYQNDPELPLKKVTMNMATTSAMTKSNKILILGIFPYLSPKRLAEHIAPIPASLSHALGDTEIRFKTAADFSKFVDVLKTGGYDIVVVQPFDVQNAINAGFEPLAQMADPVRLTLYSKSDKPISSLAVLKGKSIAAPPRESAIARLLRAELKSHQLDADRDIRVFYRRSHYSCIDQLRRNLVYACAAASSVVQNMINGKLTKELHKIYESQSIPGVMFLAKRTLPKSQREMLKRTIIDWSKNKPGRNLLKQAGFTGFVPVKLSEYQRLDHEFK